MSEENALRPGQKVATEVAESEFARFAELMDFNLDPQGWDDDDKKASQDARATIVRAIETGKVSIDDNGQPIFTPTGASESLTFREPRGDDWTAMDLKKQGNEKVIVMMARLTKQSPDFFKKMANRDFKVCGAIVGLFLLSR